MTSPESGSGFANPFDPQSGPVPPPDWDAWARYYFAESTLEEQKRLERWLKEHPEDAAVLHQVANAAAQFRPDAPPNLDVEAALRRAKMSPAFLGRVETKRKLRFGAATKFWNQPAFRMAAGLGIVILGGMIWRFGARPADEPAFSVRAELGKPDTVAFSDGSVAILEPGSQLHVPQGFGRRVRQVELSGRGWFRVRHDDRNPFLVRVGLAEVRDVGTEFSVRQLESGEVHVQVHEGTVSLRGVSQAESEAAVLNQGDQANVQGGVVSAPERGVVANDAADWASGTLHYRDVPLGEVVASLKKWYGMEVVVTDSGLGSKQVRIDITPGTLGSVVDELALAVGGRVRRVGGVVAIEK